MKIKTYSGAAILAGIATLVVQRGVVRAEVAQSYLVSPSIFEPAVYAALFVAGLLLFASAPQPSVAKVAARKLHSCVLAGYAGIAGGIAGWVVMLSLLHVVAYGSSQLPTAFGVAVLALILTLAPLWISEQAQTVFASYSSFRISPRRGMLAFQLVGVAISCGAILGFASWLLRG